MKRESSYEPAGEPVGADKRAKLDNQSAATKSAFDHTLECAPGAGPQIIDSPRPLGDEKAGPSSELDAPASSSNHDTPAAKAEDTNPGCSNPTGKNKSRGKGRGRGRDQRARTDRNAEKTGRKREWASRGTREEGQTNEAGDGQERGPRLPKKKVAMLIGFCGTGYNGMQIQREAHTNTIENTLFDALVKAGAVSKDNSDDPVKVNLQRAARTDAGVHAAGNLVSLKMITEPPDTPDLVGRLNELLPPEIRVWKFVRATNTFNSRTACDSRVYEYMFPSHALLPPRPGTPMELHTKPTNLSEPGAGAGPDWAYWERPDASQLATMRGWRIGRGQFEALRESAKMYEGTHHFHNFTVGLEHSDPSGLRYMLNIDVREPYVIDNIEWISIMYHGQSFMLHQIRKMTTLLIFASRTGTPATSLIPQTFASSKLTIPKAPSLGLLLQEPRFGTYNKHIADENELATGRGDLDRLREPIDWDSLREKIDEFKKTFIYSRIRAEEAKHGVFAAWLKFIDEYDGSEFKYLNPQGEIPAEAVVHRGKRKRGTTDKFREYLWKNPAGKGVAGEESGEDESEEEGKKPSAEMEG